MNKNLDSIHFIDRTQLSEDNFFQDILEQACNKELLEKSDIERIQYECLTLLAQKTENYNSGNSSSIQIEKAKEILNSIFYTIGLYMKTFPYPDEAVSYLKHRPINELYQNGRKTIERMTASAKAVHKKLISHLISTPNVFYNSTIIDGINGFFKLYYPDFFAHETHITADYPIFNSITAINGIEFIKAYIEAAYYENQFMSYFAANDIHHLLCGYEENYTELLMNLYEPVLIAALGCVIAETDLQHLNITAQGIVLLKNIFKQKSKVEIEKIISNATAKLCENLQCPGTLSRYIYNSLEKIINRIDSAISKNTLNLIFILPTYPENNPKIFFSYGVKMNDELYRNVIHEIQSSEYIQNKILIIKENIHSFADFEDMLLDAEMTSSEIQAVLRDLSLTEVAVLFEKYCLSLDLDELNLREQEMILRDSLKEFISTLTPENQAIIKQAGAALQEID